MRLVNPSVLRRRTEYSVRLLKELVAIPSSNPHISDKDELEIARFLREELRDAGLKVELQKVTSRPYWILSRAKNRTRYNVIPRTGRKTGTKLILNGHIDTVSGNTMKGAFEPRVVGDKLYGRGSSDMKGGVAAIIAATRAVHESGSKLRGEVVLSLVVDEETLGQGTRDFLKTERGDFAIVAEPTENTLGIAQAGYLDFNVYAKGLSRHGETTLPELWSSAFVRTTNLCNQILEDKALVRTAQRDGLRMESTFNFTPAPYSPPPSLAWATITEFRINCLLGLIPEKRITESVNTANSSLRRIRRIITSRNRDGFQAKFELLDMKPGFIQAENPHTRAFQRAMQQALGHRKRSYVLSFCDATYFYQAGIPTILFGPGKMELGHSINEYTSVRQVKDATRVFAHAIEQIVG